MSALTPLAALFEYPDEQYAARARACASALPHPALAAFAAHVEALEVTALQERFIETFDLNAAATLEIGWHIFGEQYERGELLVTLRQRLREARIEERRELPDHLLHVLPLLDAMDEADRAAFVARYLSPALEKIAAAIPDTNLFADLVRALRDTAVSAPEPAAGGCHA